MPEACPVPATLPLLASNPRPVLAGGAGGLPFADALEQCIAPAQLVAAATVPAGTPDAAAPGSLATMVPPAPLPAAVPLPDGPARPSLPAPATIAPKSLEVANAPEPTDENEEPDEDEAPPAPVPALPWAAAPAPPRPTPPSLPEGPEPPSDSAPDLLPASMVDAAPSKAPVTRPDKEVPEAAKPDTASPLAAAAQLPDHSNAGSHLPPGSPGPVAAPVSPPAPPVAAPLPSPPTTATLPLPQVAPFVASVAVSVREGAPHTLTIRLDPADLGRVEVQIERDPAGPARISLVAERPDTLHVMQRDQVQLHRALDLAGVPPDGRQVQYQLAPEGPPAPMPGTGFGASGGSAGSGGQGSAGHGPGGRERHGGYAWAGDGPDLLPTRRHRAGVDITA